MLTGTDIPPIMGMEIEELAVFAVYEGNLEPIPYQIDEYNEGGAVYFDNWDEAIEGTKNIVDGNDKLLILLGDSGPRKTPEMPVDGAIIAEVELETKSGELRYVYLVKGSRLRSDAQHVRYSIDESHVETDFYAMTFDKENQLIWKDFKYADYDGDSPIDGLKLNFESGLFSSANKLNFDNDRFVAKTIGENVGPIRTTAQLHLVFILLGMEFIDVSIQLHFYPNGLVYDVRFIMPEMRRAMLIDPKLAMSVDFNNLIGAEGIADILEYPLLADGIMSDFEVHAEGLEFPADKTGLLLRTQRGFDILTFLDWVGDNPLKTTFYYKDNLNYQGNMDRFKGQVPDAGYRVSDFPDKGLVAFVASIYFGDNFKGKPQALSKFVRSSPTIRVNF
ncbi:MAG: hypothetical protein MI976_07335 [Pseudomonadales bacterium]|nr:hypothetical protein [Pseudomonadales bacterium]